MTGLHVVVAVSAFVVLAEALNKLERADPFQGRRGLRVRLVALGWLFVPWAWSRPHVVVVLKVIGWFLLALGAGGYLVRLVLPVPWFYPDVAVIAGFAVLVVRSRLKESKPCESAS